MGNTGLVKGKERDATATRASAASSSWRSACTATLPAVGSRWTVVGSRR